MPTDYTQPQIDDSMGISDREQAERRPEWLHALATILARRSAGQVNPFHAIIAQLMQSQR